MTRKAPQIVCCFVVFCGLGSVLGGIEAATPIFRSFYHLPPADAGIILSAFNLGGIVALAFLCLPLGARWPPTWVFQACFVGGCLGMVCTRQVVAFIACCVIGGAGTGALIVRINSYIVHAFRPDSTRMLNLVNAAFGAGSILGPLLDGVGVRYNLAGAAIVIAACGGIRRLDERGGGIAMAPPQADSRPTRWAGAALSFALVTVLYSGLETGLGTWGSSQLIGLGYSVRSAAQTMSLFWVGLTIGRLWLQLLKGKIEAARLFAICVITSGLAIFLTMTSVTALVGYALTGFAVGPILPTLVALAAQRVAAIDSVTAAIFLGEALGNVTMPLVIGFAVARTSLSSLPTVIAVVACCTYAASRAAMRGTSAHVDQLLPESGDHSGRAVG